MNTRSFCCFVGPVGRTTTVSDRGRRGRFGMCIVTLTPSAFGCGIACA
jgi:hypothetical protein